MRIVLFLVLILFILILFAAGSQRLNLKSRILILICGIALFLVAFFYNESVQNKEENINKIVEEFTQGKTVKCGEFEVDKKHFNYEFGTGSFVAKSGFESLNSVIIPVEKCIEK
ncbi:putative membrane protein [Campylobacter iguaniorum]|uniref:Hypothetical membrane protein n=1 Tax=Campylobacter iguaniorum TaxID=1244531 RepID=A0A076FAP6_9BACT|nr:hypothetical protein [Campylobacter iguaniorum]AII14557.1 hypothetical membrane protein [Campylobacter iguaniorum]ALV24292.1 putative membrane protein [Campylobacter iguaniorum]ANE35712.1 putative membrane protein [Campylobacter iguaniorum]